MPAGSGAAVPEGPQRAATVPVDASLEDLSCKLTVDPTRIAFALYIAVQAQFQLRFGTFSMTLSDGLFVSHATVGPAAVGVAARTLAHQILCCVALLIGA